MIRIYQVKCASDQDSDIEAQILKKLHMPAQDLLSWSIHRKSVDARKQKVLFSYLIDAKVQHEKKYLKQKDVKKKPDERYIFPTRGKHSLESRPVVVGFGPAGMFASLLLAQAGYRPIIIERGSEVHRRKKKVETFWKDALLDPECNVQFGEGGAGAFSDGKLTTRSKDLRARKVLEEFVLHGAKDEILIDQHPHVGTDAFLKIIENIRNDILSMGGEFYFDTKLEDIEVDHQRLKRICIAGQWIDCQAMIFAAGHSATDTILQLHKRGLHLENKRYAVGVRIEHTQEFIDQAMLGDYAHDPRLIPARYQLTHVASNQKGVYSFCMCPGGYVINSSSEPGHLVINGMSYAARNAENANSALLVQVDQSDYGNQLFDGLHYQKDLEQRAYKMAGGYKACCQLTKDYLDGRVSTSFEGVRPSLPTVFTDLNMLFSSEVNVALHEALEAFERKVPGFVESGSILEAVESRSNGSLRLVRDASMMGSIFGLYPCGEGSGYAGGIMTSAIDGLKCAEKLIEYFASAK